MSDYRFVPLQVVTVAAAGPHLHGATLGEDHLTQAVTRLKPDAEEAVIVFDMSTAVSVTASYLKAGLLPVLRAQATSLDLLKGKFTSIEGSRFAFIANCNKEVAADINEFFLGRKLPVIHLDRWNDHTLHEGRLMGYLDPVLFRTLEGVSELKECTAADLASRSAETITVNGWSNRLADLYQLRLIARRRESKFWFYSPIVERVLLWA